MTDIEHEIESKISISEVEMQKVFKNIIANISNIEVKTKENKRAYFDTKNREISKAKMALRVQYTKGVGYEQTLKYEDVPSKSNTMSRIEVNSFLGNNNNPNTSLIDLSLIKDEKIKKQIKNINFKVLEHVFTAWVERRYFIVPVVKNGNKVGDVELAFDIGQVTHAIEKDLCYNISEIEVELKLGDSSAVDIMCQQILDMSPSAVLSTVSKAETGYNLDSKAHNKKNIKDTCI